jgi:hypothetical protein
LRGATEGEPAINEYAMTKAKPKPPQKSNTEIRKIVLRYFYDRNLSATSVRGKKGSAVKIRDAKSELKAQSALTQQQVMSNLTYLLSQGWVEEDTVEKSFTAPGGTVIPSTTSFYKITAEGIDKIEGPGEFTMPKFHGINISATGHNIITLGDGNQINAQFGDLGKALSVLREEITRSKAPEDTKLALVADVETIQSQLVKTHPIRDVVSAAWKAVKAAAVIDGCANACHRVSELIGPLIS